MKSNLSTSIPFEGFYYSIWDQELDSLEEREAEYLAEQETENGIAKELRLETSDFADAFYWSTDYRSVHSAVAKSVAGAWDELASESLGFDLGLSFEEMTSPKEYNFETDRVFMSMPRATLAKLMRLSRAEKHERFGAAIRARFTSRDGFISFYSNNLADWLSKPLSSWDHNEVGTLLGALVGDLNEDLALYYRVTDCDGLYHEWSAGVDWPAFEKRIADKREEKLEAIRVDDPDFIPPEPRCPFTLELPF